MREKSTTIDYFKLGWISLFLLPVPYVPLVFLKYPLRMNPDSWLETVVSYSLMVDYFLILTSAVFFLLAGIKQNKSFYVLAAGNFLIVFLMTLYVIFVG